MERVKAWNVVSQCVTTGTATAGKDFAMKDLIAKSGEGSQTSMSAIIQGSRLSVL